MGRLSGAEEGLLITDRGETGRSKTRPGMGELSVTEKFYI